MSRWLENEIKEIDEFRGKKKKDVRIMMIVFAVILGYFTYVLLKNGTNSQEFTQGLPVVGIIAFVFIFVIILATMKNNKKGNPLLEKKVARICTTNDETEQFDTEMTNEPIKTIKAGPLNGDILFTNNYLVQITGRIPLKSYRIAKFDEIKSIQFCSVRNSPSLSALGKEYWIDLLDANNKKFDMICLSGNKLRDEFFDAISNVIPGITIENV